MFRSSQYKAKKALKDSLTWAHTFYNKNQYNEAERLLQGALDKWEQFLGADDEEILRHKHWLGLSLYEQQKHVKAEQVFRQAVLGQEKVLGKENKDTLSGKYWLGVSLYRLQKYDEAEQVFRQAVLGQEKVLGKEDEDTLYSKYWLGVSLSKLQKHVEAEEVFRQTVLGREEVLGKEHKDTLDSKYWLGVSLNRLQRYNEAEQVLQEAVLGQEEVHGKEDTYTLSSKHWLGLSLYQLQKYDKAEQVLQEAVLGRETILGKENEATLDSKHGLGLALYGQETKYDEAELVLRQAVLGREKVLGREHGDTIESKRILEELLNTKASLASIHIAAKDINKTAKNTNTTAKDVGTTIKDTNTTAKDTNTTAQDTNTTAKDHERVHLNEFFLEGRDKYTDSDLHQISSLLSRLHPPWSKLPRTYTILRTIKCLDLLDEFIDLGFSDHWFPVTEKRLPNCLRPAQRREFVAAQDLVMTKSIDLEKGEGGQHAYFRRDELFPFEPKEILGSGGFGQVDKILSRISYKQYARKRVPRSRAFGGRGTEAMKQFIAEIAILKRLRHDHVVEFIGSYTDSRYIGLIMSPVADMDLSSYLTRADVAKHGELRTFFGCLARALEFLHEQSVRHKDIKPSNILVHCGNVLFTDFGLALDFTDANGSTTSSMVNGMTPRYCAPEVARYESRNTASDIWSLGVVFLEMAAVLKGKSNDFICDFLKTHGSGEELVRTNPAGFAGLIEEFRVTGNAWDNRVLAWLEQMLQENQKLRPTAAALIASIVAPGIPDDGSGRFCGICCVEPGDEWDDEVDDFADEFADSVRISHNT